MARCLSPPSNLNAITGDRNREHTDLVVELFPKTKLAKDYGIIKLLVVRDWQISITSNH